MNFTFLDRLQSKTLILHFRITILYNNTNFVGISDYKMRKYLFISAHPDDLEFSCANLIRHLAQKGHDVKILCLTKGEFGIFQQEWIGPRLARIRESELLRAAKINAITPDKIFFGEFIDGFLKFNAESVTTLIEWLNRFQPDIVFAPEALYAYYWQVDHIHCGRILHHIYVSCQDR
ncbi:MAG: PIG-L family deacetylase, partial [Promethearchaeota archaeon]